MKGNNSLYLCLQFLIRIVEQIARMNILLLSKFHPTLFIIKVRYFLRENSGNNIKSIGLFPIQPVSSFHVAN